MLVPHATMHSHITAQTAGRQRGLRVMTPMQNREKMVDSGEYEKDIPTGDYKFGKSPEFDSP